MTSLKRRTNVHWENYQSKKMSNISRNANQKQFLILLESSIPFLALSYTIITIGILLNSLEIKLIVKKIKKATDFEIVLLNLAIADLFNSIMFIVLIAVTDQYAIDREKLQQKVVIHLVTGILSFSITASLLFVMVIGIERFFAIKVPLQHRMWHTNRRRLVKYIILTWVLALVFVIIIGIMDGAIENRNSTRKSFVITYSLSGLATFGMALIFVLYGWVIYLMLMRSLKLFDFDKKLIRVNPKRIKDAMKKEKSSIIVCILVVVSFLVCNIPIIVDLFQLRVSMTSAILLKFTTVADPLIYFFKGYLERFYGKQKLVSSSSNEAEAPKENGQRGGNEMVECLKRSPGESYCNENFDTEETVTGEVIENIAANDVKSSDNKENVDAGAYSKITMI